MKKEKNDYGIGDVLRQLRRNRHLTQVRLAEKLDVSVNTIKQYENNKREPQYEYLVKICDFFNVSPDFLKSQNHYDLGDIKKREFSDLIPQNKTIIHSKNLALIKYKILLDNIVDNNNDSSHILFLIDSLNILIEDVTNIALNKKREYLLNNLKSCSTIDFDSMYFDYNVRTGIKTLKDKKISEMELYTKSDEEFDIQVDKIKSNLKKVFIANFKEDYNAYKNTFRKRLQYLKKENL